MPPENTISPSPPFTKHIPTCAQNLFPLFIPQEKTQGKEKHYTTKFTFSLYNNICFLLQMSLNMENEIMQLNFNTCMYTPN